MKTAAAPSKSKPEALTIGKIGSAPTTGGIFDYQPTVGVGSAIGGEQLFKGLLVDKKIDHAALATYEIMNYLKKTDPSSYENDKVGIGSANGSSSGTKTSVPKRPSSWVPPDYYLDTSRRPSFSRPNTAAPGNVFRTATSETQRGSLIDELAQKPLALNPYILRDQQESLDRVLEIPAIVVKPKKVKSLKKSAPSKTSSKKSQATESEFGGPPTKSISAEKQPSTFSEFDQEQILIPDSNSNLKEDQERIPPHYSLRDIVSNLLDTYPLPEGVNAIERNYRLAKEGIPVSQRYAKHGLGIKAYQTESNVSEIAPQPTKFTNLKKQEAVAATLTNEPIKKERVSSSRPTTTKSSTPNTRQKSVKREKSPSIPVAPVSKHAVKKEKLDFHPTKQAASSEIKKEKKLKKKDKRSRTPNPTLLPIRESVEEQEIGVEDSDTVTAAKAENMAKLAEAIKKAVTELKKTPRIEKTYPKTGGRSKPSVVKSSTKITGKPVVKATTSSSATTGLKTSEKSGKAQVKAKKKVIKRPSKENVQLATQEGAAANLRATTAPVLLVQDKDSDSGTMLASQNNNNNNYGPLRITSSPSVDEFARIQHKSIEDQYKHILEKQTNLEKDVLQLLESLQKKVDDTTGTAPAGDKKTCCCDVETKEKLSSIVRKQKQIINLQSELHQRYGFNNLASISNPNTERTHPILNGFCAHIVQLSEYLRTIDGKPKYYCPTCDFSATEELLFRAHIESSDHLTRAYKENRQRQVPFSCDYCSQTFSGTTKYMYHVLGMHLHGEEGSNSNSNTEINVKGKSTKSTNKGKRT